MPTSAEKKNKVVVLSEGKAWENDVVQEWRELWLLPD